MTQKLRRNDYFAMLILLFFLVLCSNKSLAQNYSSQFGQSIGQVTVAANDGEAISAQADHAIKREITVIAPVKKLLAEDTQGLPHQRFLIQLSNGVTVLIAHDLKYAPRVPIKAGDLVRIHGEYIWNRLGGLIHWTHHSDSPKHESGWIEFNGMRYE